MRLILIIIVTASAAWTGYWYIGQKAVETGLTAWFDGRRADGWVADYSSLYTQGLPNRFDTTIEDIELADPATGLAWSAPFFQFKSLSYKPNHIIAIWPNDQSLSTPQERIEIRSSDMRGSLVFDANTALAINRASIVLTDFVLNSDAGWSASISDGLLAVRQTAAKANFYDLAFEASQVKPATDILRRLDPTGALPDNFKTLKIDATGGFDAPWDRFAVEDRRPQLTELNLKLVQATWGDLDLRAAGKLVVDSTGTPTGKITVKATNWREMLSIAIASGVLSQGLANTLEGGLEAIAGLSGNSKTIDLPLTFKNGRVSLGFLPLGPAPRLVIR